MRLPFLRLRRLLLALAAGSLLLGGAATADTEPVFHGLRVRFSLGMSRGGNADGQLLLSVNSPSGIMARRESLALVGDENDFKAIRDAEGVRQVSAPAAFVDLVTVSPSKYEVRFYAPANRGILTNGLYAPTGAPYQVQTIEDPDAAGMDLKRLRITSSKTGSVATYEWIEANAGWSVATRKADGSVDEIIKIVTAWQQVPKGGIRPLGWTVTSQSKDAAGQVTKWSQRSLYGFPWGDELVQEVSGFQGEEEVTTTYFQQDPAAPDYGKPVGKTFPDGSWEYYEHNRARQQTKLRKPFGNEPYPGSDAVSRVVQTTHGAFGYEQPLLTVIETVQGVETARRYTVRENDGVQFKFTEIECRTPGAGIRAADNLVTITWNNPTDREFASWPTRILRPDGTLETYAYTLDLTTRERTTVRSVGKPDASKQAVREGTRTTTRVSASGEVISENVVDIATGR